MKDCNQCGKCCIKYSNGCLTTSASQIDYWDNNRPAYRHPQDALYIFGPEDGTISQSIIDRADAVVYVPTVGCMNLAATVNVILYDRLAKSSNDFCSSLEANRLIRKSRDINNCLKVG